MAAEEFSSEAELQKLLVDAVKNGELRDLVTDSARLVELAADDDSDAAFMPILSIDHITRRACIRHGALALRSLDFLELLTADKNVSISKGEALRPDIVCYNPGRESLALFELKKEGQTARQALTELLAYEQEIKNQLPFLGSCDVTFVLVSPEWTTLMDHAAASAATWSGKRILCLEAGVEGGKLSLRTRIPSAWKITGSALFPQDSISAVTLSLNDIFDDGKNVDHRLITAMQVMAREGDRSGSNGFAILWRDHWGHSQAKFAITLCGISPFAFYKACRQSGFIADGDGSLAAQLDDVIRRFDPGGHGDGLMLIAKSANAVLEEISDPTLEGFMTWHVWLESARARAEPIMCEAWGILGDHARRMVLNPTVRKYGRPRRQGMGDWTDPAIAIPMINELFGKQTLSSGDVDCSSSFRLGCLIGTDWILRNLINDNDLPSKSAARQMFRWNSIELFAVLDEVQLLVASAQNVDAPKVPLRVTAKPEPFDEVDFENFINWLREQFLQSDPVHTHLFNTGMAAATLFGDVPRLLGDVQIDDELAQMLRDALGRLVEQCEQGLDESALTPDVQENYAGFLEAIAVSDGKDVSALDSVEPELLASAWDRLLELSDAVFDTVFHRHADMAPSRVDWAWLRQGVEEARARGDNEIGIVVSASGIVGTGRVFPNEIPRGAIPIQLDPATQVCFLDLSNGFGVMTVRAWAELENAESLSRLGPAGGTRGSGRTGAADGGPIGEPPDDSKS